MSFTSDFIINKRPEPFPGYKFTAIVNLMPMGFSKISNIEISFETETFKEGGVNDYVHVISNQASTEKTLVLERGIAFRGLAFQEASDLKPGQKIVGDIVLLVYDRDGGIAKIYFVGGATVKKWTCSDYDASSSELLIERFELTYETFEAKFATATALIGIL